MEKEKKGIISEFDSNCVFYISWTISLELPKLQTKEFSPLTRAKEIQHSMKALCKRI